jgi:hypothetical protein
MFGVIRLLEAVGLAWDVSRPDQRLAAAHMDKEGEA